MKIVFGTVFLSLLPGVNPEILPDIEVLSPSGERELAFGRDEFAPMLRSAMDPPGEGEDDNEEPEPLGVLLLEAG